MGNIDYKEPDGFMGTPGKWWMRTMEAEYDPHSNCWFCVIWHKAGKVLTRIYGVTKIEAESNFALAIESKEMAKSLQSMTDVLARVAFMFGNEANYPEGTIGYKLGQKAKREIANAKEILIRAKVTA